MPKGRSRRTRPMVFWAVPVLLVVVLAGGFFFGKDTILRSIDSWKAPASTINETTPPETKKEPCAPTAPPGAAPTAVDLDKCFQSVQAGLGVASGLAGRVNDQTNDPKSLDVKQKREQLAKATAALSTPVKPRGSILRRYGLPALTSLLLLSAAVLLYLARRSASKAAAARDESDQAFLNTINSLKTKAEEARTRYNQLSTRYTELAGQSAQRVAHTIPEAPPYISPPAPTVVPPLPTPGPTPEPAPAAPPDPSLPTSDIVADYNRARATMGNDAANWFFGHYRGTPLSCRNLADRRINPAAKLLFEPSSRGDFLAIDRAGRTLLFPVPSRDLGQSRAFLEGVFRFPEESGTLRLEDPAIVQTSDGEWVLERSGVLSLG